MLSAQLSELEKDVETSNKENSRKFKLLTEKMETQQEVEAKLKKSAASMEAQAQLHADVEALADELGELKKLVTKDSTSLATNIKHTSKLLLDLSALKANEDMNSKSSAEKFDQRELAEKADLLPLDSVRQRYSRHVHPLGRCTQAVDGARVDVFLSST
jgi:phage-related tail protein